MNIPTMNEMGFHKVGKLWCKRLKIWTPNGDEVRYSIGSHWFKSIREGVQYFKSRGF